MEGIRRAQRAAEAGLQAGEALIRPETFHAAANYYGYTPDRPIRILRRPEAGDFALTGQQSHQPYANTTTVIRLLEARAAAGTPRAA